MKIENNPPQINHTVSIQKYIEVIWSSPDFHALIVEGSPGWGKTTAVENALDSINMDYELLGSYSTPLNLYNFLFENYNRIVLLDDCAGLFHDKGAMAILKSATWSSCGKKRMIKWGSTSSVVQIPYFSFTGKLIIVCNSFPNTPDGDAVRSRSFVRHVDVTLTEAKELITKAAQDENWFKDTKISMDVAKFLIEKLNEDNLSQVSYRTLKKGYSLATTHKDSWKDLFTDIVPKGFVSPESLVEKLSKQNIKVKEQSRIFQEKTGLKLRSFYNYRKDLNLTKADEVVN